MTARLSEPTRFGPTRFGPTTLGLALLAGGSFLALCLAWAAEFGLGLPPCDLCYTQRHAYWAAMAICVLGLVLPGRSRLALFGLALLAVAAGGGIAAYHAGIEWQWWPGPESCTASAMPASLDDFGALFDSDQRITSCGEAPMRVFGLSMAGWNVLYALGLCIAGALAVRLAPGRSMGSVPGIHAATPRRTTP